MSSLFKTTSKGKAKARTSQLPAADVAGTADDIALEAGDVSDADEEEDVDMDDSARPAKKAKVSSEKKGESEDGPKRRKDKVLMLSSRGTTQRMRHLMLDLEALLPHVKKGEQLTTSFCVLKIFFFLTT